MSAKTILTLVLMIFVLFSAVYLIVQNTNTRSEADDSESTAIVQQDIVKDQVIAYYLHGTRRCPTCNKIEKLSDNAIRTGFAEQLENETLAWKTVNFDEPENEHYYTDFGLVAQSLVLVEFADGEMVRWENLAKIWDLVGDEEAFTTYVQNNIKTYLGEN